MKITVTTTHPRGAELLRRALDNYAHVQTCLIVNTSRRALNASESEADRQRLVDTYTSRESAAIAMAHTITTET